MTKDQLQLSEGIVSDMFLEGAAHIDASSESVSPETESVLTEIFTEVATRVLTPFLSNERVPGSITSVFPISLEQQHEVRSKLHANILELGVLTETACHKPTLFSFARVISRSLIEGTLIHIWQVTAGKTPVPNEAQREFFAGVEKTLSLLEGLGEETRARCLVYSVVGVIRSNVELEDGKINAVSAQGETLLKELQEHVRTTRRKAVKRKL